MYIGKRVYFEIKKLDVIGEQPITHAFHGEVLKIHNGYITVSYKLNGEEQIISLMKGSYI